MCKFITFTVTYIKQVHKKFLFFNSYKSQTAMEIQRSKTQKRLGNKLY